MRYKNCFIIRVILFIIILFQQRYYCNANSFLIKGARALGIGSAYWNPASYSFINNNKIEIIPLCINLIATHDIVKEIDDVEQYKEIPTIEQFLQEIEDLKKEKMGLIANAYAGIDLSIKPCYGLSVSCYRQAVGIPYFKVEEIGGYENAYLKINYIRMKEYIFTLAKRVSENLAWGINIKYLINHLSYSILNICDNKDVEKKVRVTLEGENTSIHSKLGLDLGLIYLMNDKFNFGLIIRNLNSPKFYYKNSKDYYQLEREIRGGFSYKNKKNIILSLDCDLTKNNTLLKGYKSKILAFDLELPLYANYFVLRAGVMKNLVEDDIGQVYTFGFGFNNLRLQADIGVGISNKRTKKSKTGDVYPCQMIGSLNFSLNF